MAKRTRPPGAGRKKGTPNRLTKAFKELVEGVLDEPKTLEKLRKLRDSRNAVDRSTFWRLAGKFVPTKIEATKPMVLRVLDYSENRVDEREDDDGEGQ